MRQIQGRTNPPLSNILLILHGIVTISLYLWKPTWTLPSNPPKAVINRGYYTLFSDYVLFPLLLANTFFKPVVTNDTLERRLAGAGVIGVGVAFLVIEWWRGNSAAAASSGGKLSWGWLVVDGVVLGCVVEWEEFQKRAKARLDLAKEGNEEGKKGNLGENSMGEFPLDVKSDGDEKDAKKIDG